MGTIRDVGIFAGMHCLKLLVMITGLACLNATTAHGQLADPQAYYLALASNNQQTFDAELDALDKATITNKDAFVGALRMKRAGTLKGPANKLKEFKAGKEKLEKVIAANPDNPEFRFLRLMIQENAPRILGYHDNVEDDKKILQADFKSLPAAVQKVVLDYSKTSKVIKPADF